MSKEKILKEYRKKFGLCDGSLKYCGCKKELDFISKAIDQTKEETLKELIREYQDNELDGKEYDFYFSIRAKIDELNKLNK